MLSGINHAWVIPMIRERDFRGVETDEPKN